MFEAIRCGASNGAGAEALGNVSAGVEAVGSVGNVDSAAGAGVVCGATIVGAGPAAGVREAVWAGRKSGSMLR